MIKLKYPLFDGETVWEGAAVTVENAPIRDEEKEKIAHCNAENLFKMKG